jgi:hypothetical protein
MPALSTATLLSVVFCNRQPDLRQIEDLTVLDLLNR